MVSNFTFKRLTGISLSGLPTLPKWQDPFVLNLKSDSSSTLFYMTRLLNKALKSAETEK